MIENKKLHITPVGEVGDVSGGPRLEDCQGDLLDGAPGVPDGALHGVQGEDQKDVQNSTEQCSTVQYSTDLEHGVQGEDQEDVPPPPVHRHLHLTAHPCNLQ